MARLRYARRQEYNIILVDFRMPEQDGVEVTRELRKVVGQAATVIILTVYDWSDVEREAVEAGLISLGHPSSISLLPGILKYISP